MLRHDALYNARSTALQHSTTLKLSVRQMIVSELSVAGQSSVLEPVPWLQLGQIEDDLPYFLWDISGKQTVLVNKLGFIPTYTCISHTWGRWRKSNSVTITGVDGWKVPENTRFQIEKLPSIFASLQWKTPYLWFDLFCIPQDGSRKAAEEIARQASIFRRSSYTFAWFTDVDNWSGTQKAIDWLLANYLLSTSTFNVDENLELVERNASSANRRIELLKTGGVAKRASRFLRERVRKSHQDVDLLIHETPTDWFTSLWTLQESFLCPHMLLLDANWRPLTSSSGACIGLDNLMSLIDLVNTYDISSPLPGERTQLAWSSWPNGPRQLAGFAVLTDLKHILLPSPTAALVLGNRRHCSERRAEAVMSVTGATEWYKKATVKHQKIPPQDELVLGTYPLPFAQEVSRKTGGQFWTSLHPRDQSAGMKEVEYSMLPFDSPNDMQQVPFLGAEIHIEYTEDHSALSTWLIDKSGSVRIEQAGILGSSLGKCKSDIAIQLISREGGEWTSRQTSLPEVLGTQPRSEPIILVSLYRTPASQIGLVLHGTAARAGGSNHLTLSKVGVFNTRYREFPPSENVSWIVW